MKTKLLMIVCLLCNFVGCARAATYMIYQNGIADHANASTLYSIAWYFKTYGASNTYVLTSPGVSYTLNATLTVPANSILMGSTNAVTYTLLAASGLDGGTMVSLSNGSSLQNLTVDGNRYAAMVVKVTQTTDTTVRNCLLQNTKNNFTGGGYAACYWATSSTNAVLDSCTLLNAGCNPKLNGANNQAQGLGILMWTATNALIQKCVISNCLTCGIGMGGSTGIQIFSNYLAQTGLNRNPTNGVQDGPIADGITAYHNWVSWPQNFTIIGNTINGTGNHGIHVSGSAISIQNNTIFNQQLCAVQVDDWRTPLEYSDYVVIRSNYCGDPLSWVWAPGNSNRKISLAHYNNRLPFDYQTNFDTNGGLLSVTSSNYNIGAYYGPYVFGNTNNIIKAMEGKVLNASNAYTCDFHYANQSQSDWPYPTDPNTVTWDIFSNPGTFTLGTNMSWAALIIQDPTNDITISDTNTLTLGGGGINMSNAAVNLTLNHPVVLGANQTWVIASNRLLTVNGVVAGAASLIQNGAGTLVLTGNNTYTGGTALNGGVLSLGSSGAIGNSGVISFGGGTLQFSAANTNDYSARFSTAANQAYHFDTGGQTVSLGSALTSPGGSLTKNGAGTLALQNTNAYTGATLINAGTVSVNNGAAFGATSAGTTVAAGAQIFFSAGSSTAEPFTINGATGTGALRFVNSGVNLSGPITLASDSLISGLYNVMSGPVNLGGYTLTVAKNKNVTDLWNGPVSGNGGVTLAAIGTNTSLTLNGDNTYTGNTTISNGTLILGSSGSLSFVIGAAGINNALTGMGSLVLDGALRFDLTGAGASLGNQWLIVRVPLTNVTYGASFKVAGFTASGSGLWTATANGANYQFNQTNGILSVTSGSLSLVSQVSPPAISSVRIHGANLIFGGTNGTPGGSYTIYSSTNLMLAIPDWPMLTNGKFGPLGEFSVTNSINPDEPGRFFLISQP